jgi:hypothetical protein
MSIQASTPFGLAIGALAALALSAPSRLAPVPAQELVVDVARPNALHSPRRGDTALLVVDPGPVAADYRAELANGAKELVDLAQELDLPLISVHPPKELQDPAANPFLDVVPDGRRFEREGPSALTARGLDRALDTLRAKDIVVVGSLRDGSFVVTLLDLLRSQSRRVYFIANLARPETDSGWQLALQRVTAAGAIPVAADQLALELIDSWSSNDGDSVQELLEDETPTTGESDPTSDSR